MEITVEIMGFTHGDFWFTDAIQMTIREDNKIVLLLINSGSNGGISMACV